MELIKNMVLAVLVLLSLVLSWQLMTYHPQYDYLTQDYYDQLEGLADSKEWQELFKPHLVVYHLEGEAQVALPTTHAHQYIVQKIGQWELERLKPINAERRLEWETALTAGTGLEFYFWQEQPLEAALHLFQSKDEGTEEWRLPEDQSELVTIRRILLFQNPRFENEVALIMVKGDGQLLESRVTNLNWRELETLIDLGKEHDLYHAVVVNDQMLSPAVHYLPDEPIMMEEMEYRFKRIPIHHMLSYLFVDPSLVRRIEEKGNTILYLHGPRGVQVDRDYTTMSYFHPLIEQPETEKLMETINPNRAIQFVNQHKGWDKEYFFDQLRSYSDQLLQFQFREYLGSYPVYSDQGARLSTLTLELKLGRVVGYSRSLLQRGEMVESRTRELPSGSEVAAALQERGISLSQIGRIQLGYRQVVDGPYLRYKPCWLIEYIDGQRWFITQLDHEGGEAS